MKILVAASDLTPLVSTDARQLARTAPSLPLAFQRAGHEVSLIGPLLPAIEKSAALKIKPTGVQITVPLGNERLTVQVAEARSAQGMQMFLLRHERIFGQLPDGTGPGQMNAPAASLFSKVIVELARRLNPAPDVIQVQDWPGALAPLYIKTHHLPFASVLAITDPSQQGSFPIEDFGLLNLGWEHFRPTSVEFYGRVNFLKGGLLAASALVADGDLERDALLTPEYGGRLDAVLRENAEKLHGIPGGLDEQTWNPAKDPYINRKFQPSNLAGKLASRNALLSHLGLDKNPTGPVFLLDLAAGQDQTLIGLLAGQLDQLLAGDVRFIVLGALPGPGPAAVTLAVAARKHSTRFALVAAPDERLTHLALAGADFQLFFGRNLASSESFLRSLKYGTLPIAPASPGLKQITEDYQPALESGTGLVFYHRTAEGLFDVLARRAPALLEPADRWESLRQRVMVHAGKFTWARTAAQYVALYSRLTQ